MAGQQVILTPEKVAVSFTLSGLASRSVAAAVDLLLMLFLQTAILGGLSRFMDPQSSLYQSIALILGAFIIFLYFGLQLVWMKGQTLGKKVTGLRVVMADGTPLTASAAIYRTLLLPADMFPCFGLAGLISMFVSPLSQRVGDLAAGTIVIHDGSKGLGYVPAPHHIGVHPWEHVVGDLRGMTLEEYFAIKRLTDRFPELPGRQQEASIAEIWTPFATRQGIPSVANVHPIYLMEAVVMKFGRMNKLI